MADHNDDNQKNHRDNGCGCCNEKRHHDDKKDHCDDKCISECEFGQQTMEFYSYVQSVENRFVGGYQLQPIWTTEGVVIIPVGAPIQGIGNLGSAILIGPNTSAAGYTIEAAYKSAESLGLKLLLPRSPRVEPVKYFGPRDLLLIVEYIIKRINELCIPEVAKISIIDKLVAALHKINDDIHYGIDNNFQLGKGFSFCEDSRIPDCGPIYIANDRIVIHLLQYAQFLLRSFFINSCDCDLTFQEACKFVFGRFRIVTVPRVFDGGFGSPI